MNKMIFRCKLLLTAVIFSVATPCPAQQEPLFHIAGRVYINVFGELRPAPNGTSLCMEEGKIGVLISDSSGVFRLDNLPAGEHLITLNAMGYKPTDTLITLNGRSIDSARLLLKLTGEENYNPEKARKDLLNGTAHIYIFGGIAPVIYGNENQFHRKYKVSIAISGCVIDASPECWEAYNRVVFEYLDSHYGSKWRRDLRRTDAEGFTRWIKAHPNPEIKSRH